MNPFKSSKNRKQNQSRNPNFEGGSSKVVRYYRPETDKTKSKLRSTEDRNSDEKKYNSSKPLTRIARTAKSWIGFVIIAIILVANTTISGVSVKLYSLDNTGGFKYRNEEDYYSKINQILASSLLNKSKLSINTSQVEAQIKSVFPEIEDATPLTPLVGRTMQIGIKLSAPLAKIRDLKNGAGWGVMTSTGAFVPDNDVIQNDVALNSLPVLTLQNVNLKEGEVFLTDDEVSLLNGLRLEFDGTSSWRPKIRSIEYDILKREIKVRFQDLNYYVKMTPERDGREQLAVALTTIKNLQKKNITPQDYLDVRVEGRVFVK